jgi:uncharacterized membrane protein YsdA (DUF1294 family)
MKEYTYLITLFVYGVILDLIAFVLWWRDKKREMSTPDRSHHPDTA